MHLSESVVYANHESSSFHENNHVTEVSKFHDMDLRNIYHATKENKMKQAWKM